MKFIDYYNSLDKDAAEAYAARAGTTTGYIYTHLIPGRKTPKPDLMRKLSEASQGRVKLPAVLDHFYGDREKKAAAV